MSEPTIVAEATPVEGVSWRDATDRRLTLAEALSRSSRPPTPVIRQHLEALDQTMIEVATNYGEVLGGGRSPQDADEREALRTFHLTVDRLIREYVDGLAAAGLAADILAGQVVGTASLLCHRARLPLGLVAPAPLTGHLDEPGVGVVAGYGEFEVVDVAEPWRGGRWIVRCNDGRRLPATLTTLMLDSSGVDQPTTLDTHRSALTTVIDAAATLGDDIDQIAAAAGALDWMLIDWLMAHRYESDTVAIRIDSGRLDDAWMIVDAAATSIRLRTSIDPGA